MIRGQRVSDFSAGVEADDGEALVSERFHQRNEVVSLRAGVVPALRGVGEPNPALVDCDDSEVPRQRRHH